MQRAARRVRVVADHFRPTAGHHDGDHRLEATAVSNNTSGAAVTPPFSLRREHFPYLHRITTRWADNDMYGHANNVVYYGWMDTTVNNFLIQHAGFVPTEDGVVGYCVESGCTFKKSVAFPQTVECGLRVRKLGRSSVQYEIGIFAEGSAELAALGYFVHVFVDRRTERPTPIPPSILGALMELQSPSQPSIPRTASEDYAAEYISDDFLDAVLSLGIAFAN